MQKEKTEPAVTEPTVESQETQEAEEKKPAILAGEMQEVEAKEKPRSYVGETEMRALRKSGYDQIRNTCTTTFVIQNKRQPDKVAEIRAVSSHQACKLIGWRPRHCRILQVREDDGAGEDIFSRPQESRASGLTSTVSSVV